MSTSHILGFPRIGKNRELKFALEAFWQGQITEAELQNTCKQLRKAHWALQKEAGLDYVTVGDFCLYDHVLNTLAHVGGLPARFNFSSNNLTTQNYFDAARGNAEQAAMEMTKWFDTNYHYLVPEYTAQQSFEGGVHWLFEEITEAQSQGHAVKAVLLGPVSLLYLGKENGEFKDRLTDELTDHSTERLTLLPALIKAYQRVLSQIKSQQVEWVQIDEPILALDLPEAWLDAVDTTYKQLAIHKASIPKLLLTTYFGDVSAYKNRINQLPVDGLHIDLVKAPEQLGIFLEDYPKNKVLSCGIIDGRNIWSNHLNLSLKTLEPAHQLLGKQLWISSSCSLLHTPVDLNHETQLHQEIKPWLAFALQKIDEIKTLQTALDKGQLVVAKQLAHADHVAQQRADSLMIHHASIQEKVAALNQQDGQRNSPYAQRKITQQAHLNLPLLPTTTIGSFPQTQDIRAARSAFKKGQLKHTEYLETIRQHIRFAIQKQEDYGLDVLVHGEAERNDMAEYFAETLYGFAVTENGWVQSYGSRCVKPPIIYGDVIWKEPITLGWTTYAQSLTTKPVKGMLTGPVTLLQWSFVREDQARETTALQIALALRQEVKALEDAGIAIIQIDEPALREGLPLKLKDRTHYLDWAAYAFRVASSGVKDQTQIHTHMCYSEFEDMLSTIAALDADVISIETARSKMTLLDAFDKAHIASAIGPGIYDIHSPQIPAQHSLETLIKKALLHISADQLWINPDCGLKTRQWEQVDIALSHMVAATLQVREQILETA